MDKSVDSELSGNIIDLCPVGALTSKPFRYSARSWELTRRPTIAAHDGLGSHVEVHVKNDRVMRIVPREKESINEVWLSDRDRFSYDGLNSPERLTKPMIKHHGEWHETDWKTALEYAARQIKETVEEDPAGLGFLVSPNATMEEGFLTKKIAKSLDCGNVDHRLRRSDFRLDGRFHGTPWMGCNIADVQAMDRILVVGSNLRNEHPLLTQRMRRAVANGAELSIVNPMDDDQLMKVSHQAICSPNDIVNVLAQILKAMSGLQRLSLCLPKSISDLLEGVVVRENSQAIAESLAGHGKEYDLVNPKSALFLGNIAQYHPRYAEIYTLAEAISSLCGATFGVLFESSDRVGLDMVRVIPGQGGLNARTMLEQPRKTYVLLNVEPEFDCANPAVAKHAMEKADCVIALTSYKSSALENADVLLPIAPFTETSGTRMSMEGRVQSFTAAVKPLGEARPAWKVLRVLANTLGLDGFNFESSEQVKTEVFGGEKPSTVVWNRLNNNLRILFDVKVQEKTNVLQRLGEVPQYRMDSVVRRSSPLQKTKQVAEPVAGMNAKLMAELGVQEGDLVVVKQGIGSAKLKVTLDAGLAKGTVRVPTGYDVTASLGELMGEIEVARA